MGPLAPPAWTMHLGSACEARKARAGRRRDAFAHGGQSGRARRRARSSPGDGNDGRTSDALLRPRTAHPRPGGVEGRLRGATGQESGQIGRKRKGGMALPAGAGLNLGPGFYFERLTAQPIPPRKVACSLCRESVGAADGVRRIHGWGNGRLISPPTGSQGRRTPLVDLGWIACREAAGPAGQPAWQGYGRMDSLAVKIEAWLPPRAWPTWKDQRRIPGCYEHWST